MNFVMNQFTAVETKTLRAVGNSTQRDGCGSLVPKLLHPTVGLGHFRKRPAFVGAARVSHRGMTPAGSLSYRKGRESSNGHLAEETIVFMGKPGERNDEVRNIGTKAAAAGADASASSSGLGTVLASVVAASMGAFCFGYALSVVNGPLDAIAAELGFAGNANLQGLVVSSSLIGAAFGSMNGSAVADNMGRKFGLLFVSVPLVAGSLLCAMASTFNLLAAGRALTGMGIGLASALVPVYISEVAPTSLRGALGTANQLAICLGILGGLVANVLLPATQWRNMFYLGAIPAALLALGMLFSPESPRYLQGKGKNAEAEAEAIRLWGTTAELGGAGEGEKDASTSGPGLGELLSKKGVLVGMMMFVFQQFSGINAIIYFSTRVFQQAGVQSTALASAFVGATNVCGTLIAGGVIEKAGRKQLLVLSYLGMAASMFAMAAGLGFESMSSISGNIALVGTVAYILSFAIGAGPVSGLLVPEITGPRIRGSAMSMAMLTHWLCNVLIGQFFLATVTKYGVSKVYTAFGAVCILAVLYIQAAVVETKGKTIDQIEKMMA